jgi:phosphate transport system permease protein
MERSTENLESAALRRLIRRRRIADLLFATLGLALVVGSLTVLVVLFGQLVRDGAGRLVTSHEVKANGTSPGRRELVGELKRVESPTGSAWVLARQPADIPEDLEADDPMGKADVPLDLAAVQERIVALAGQRVVVDVGRAKKPPLAVRDIEPLHRQSFFASMPSRDADRAGIKSALIGSVLVVAVTMLLAIPLGVGAGVYLEEYGRKNWRTAIIEINIANLAGVPSIIWGLMALGLFVYFFGLGRSILTAGMTLGLLVLPIVIMATREAIRAIPQSIREAAYACGASRWQTTRYHIIPYSLSGILTGTIIGLSRAIGETAPLITIGALTYIAFLPEFSWSAPFAWLKSEFTVLPIQMFNWISRPDPKFHENAAAAGVVLLVLTLTMNGLAIYLRFRLRRSIQW